MMLKLLFWIALGVLVAMALRSKLKGAVRDQRPAAGHPPRPLAEGEAMACCAHCHVYFPVSEAVRADGLDYCSPAHVRLPPQ
jgi:uncharacterized protein